MLDPETDPNLCKGNIGMQKTLLQKESYNKAIPKPIVQLFSQYISVYIIYTFARHIYSAQFISWPSISIVFIEICYRTLRLYFYKTGHLAA